MSLKELSSRLERLEREVALLRGTAPAAKQDWRDRPGAVVDDPHYAEMTRLGRAYRVSQRPKKRGGKRRART